MQYLILGAGPSGLAAANQLKHKGISDFLVLEKEKNAGGLCRSVIVDGSPFDIGGGHFLDVRRPAVNRFLFSFMPENEWNKYERDSRIYLNGQLISHPIEANIWQMKMEEQLKYLKSAALAGCNTEKPVPEKFVDWIYWKLGTQIADHYMIPYNKKMFGAELDQLGTYWLEKLPDVSFEQTLLSCLTKKAHGSQPGHAQFYYPKKHGYGELWLRMAKSIEHNIEYNKDVKQINFDTKSVITEDGNRYHANIIITTIPWTGYEHITGMPEEILEGIQYLRHSSIQTEYFPENLDTACHWIYCPEESLSYHRILVRHNFCQGNKGYWTETNAERVHEGSQDHFRYMNKYAYPLNTVDKPQIMKSLLSWCKSKAVFGLGRWGEHQHYNSDVAVERAIEMIDELTAGDRRHI